MRDFIGAKRLTLLLSFAIGMAVWWTLTRLYSPLVVPTVSSVAATLVRIVLDPEMLYALWLTVWRLLAGLGLGVVAGTTVGAILGFCPRLHTLFRPFVGLLQSVPPVSWLVLALIWFGFSGRASVFIVVLASLPIMTVTVIEGVRHIDVKLVQMAKLYRFSPGKRLVHVVIPSVLPYFRAGLQVALGTGSKTVIMGEVLTTSSGIGGQITNARLNLEPESVVAWTIVIVCVYYLFNHIAALLLRDRKARVRHADNSQPAQALWGLGGAGGSRPEG